ncbi:MAG TPA: hypothetical protein PK855_03970 [Bacteroidales bacterium]|nr:hypothetical protein [Bacteroidales bacterium]
MGTDSTAFFGKIMLFGEYSVILGSKALVMPLKQFSGSWSWQKCSLPDEMEMREALLEYAVFLNSEDFAKELVDTVKLLNDVRKGLWFKTNIPQGYGAGSSGALVAAIFSGYAFKKQYSPEQLKTALGLLEGYFHGSSSGIDPLCCYYREAVLIGEDNKVALPGQFDSYLHFNIYLFDSKSIGMTAPLVDFFRNRMEDYSFYKKVKTNWIPSVNAAIDQFLTGDKAAFDATLRVLSVFERENLPLMIPESAAKKWDRGLETGHYTMKLCGSGGGGFFLVFSERNADLSRHFELDRLIRLI